MNPLRLVAGVWAAPLSWGALLALGARTGRLDATTAAVAAVTALLGVGLTRAIAGRRGGLPGRWAELLLMAAAVGWLVAEPASQRVLVALGGAVAASALAVTGAWPRDDCRPRLVAVVGAAVGVVLTSAVIGAPWWPVQVALIIASLTITGRLLCTVTEPALAAAALPALAVAIGPGHTLAWLLPPLAAAAMAGERRSSTWWPLAAAVAAAALPPAGLAVSVAVVVMACRGRRSLVPLAALVPAAVLAWWLLPPSAALLQPPSLSAVANVLHLSPTSLPLLLPAAALGIVASRRARVPARDGLIAGLLVLPVVGLGPWLMTASAVLWLLGLAAADGCAQALRRTLPWTIGVGLALLVMAPWGGARHLHWSPPWLTIGWVIALVLSLVPCRLVQLAWILPAAGLVWVFPVEGSDRVLEPGQHLRLPAVASEERMLAVGLARQANVEPGDVVLRDLDGSMAPILGAGACPPAGSPAVGPLLEPVGRGREAALRARAVSRRSVSGEVVLEAAAPVIVRTEDAAAWRGRRARYYGLLGGALVLLAAAMVVKGSRDPPLQIATVALFAAVVAAGSGIAPLARAAVLGAADAAAVVHLVAWMAVLPVLGRRRFVAGALLLVPIALAQPLLRGPAGDEVYHLQLLESLASDRDLAVANNLHPDVPEQAAYRHHGDTLIHSPAPALLTLPGYLVLGHAGALAVLALALAAGAALAARHAVRVGMSRRCVSAAWLLTIATYPAVTFASQLWPAAIGVLVVGLLLAAAARPSPIAAAAAAAVALTVKVRFALLALPLALVATRRRPRSVATVGLLVAAALAMVAFTLGSPLGRHRLAAIVPGDPWHPVMATWGLLFDGAGGLALSAPLWLVALVAIPALWRRGDSATRSLVVGAALTVAALAVHDTGEWYGGGAPPARYLVPCLPLVLLALAELLRRPAGRRLVGLVLPWAAVASWVALTRPLWLYNPVDGGWWLVDRLAAALDGAARNLLPSLLRPGPAVVVVPLLLTATAWWWARRPRVGAAATVMVGLLAVAAATAGGRESAVHAEDPQVVHRGGVAEPPPGTLHRARGRISWRLAPGDEIVLPWRAPHGRRLQGVVRLEDSAPPGTLEAWWHGAPPTGITVKTARWRRVALPPPVTLGRGWLHLRWAGAEGSPAVLHVDKVVVER